ncbi:hypothetical protein HHK36_016354 [Tetracentron sinense]|uniref:Cyclin-like domain-containing protein n=1 Tax=Tetracentron sinense TaxID=13715 RepID=A0A834Z063_TETSI|nr:hypothetical protein HHK36_016354 [Tetracentron sinense]
MESLLCDEDWLSTDPVEKQHCLESCVGSFYFYTTGEDHEHALTICLHKEMTYMPKAGYVELLRSSDLIAARSRTIRWFIKSRRRLNLSLGTLFDAVNYLDRFISMNHCHGWKIWMIELLSVACLSIAAKFSETSIPLFHEIQMEDLDHSFQPGMIQQMELTILQALGWRLGPTTAYSYVEFMTWKLETLQPHLHDAITSRVAELLLGALSDPKFLELRPCLVAVSALRCSLEELLPSKSDTHLAYFVSLIPDDHKDDLDKCHKIMEERVVDPLYSLIACGNSCCPSSPVTVMTREQINVYGCYVDLSLFKMSGSNVNCKSNTKKRKREEEAENHQDISQPSRDR